MKLNAPERPLAVLNPHHDAAAAARGHAQLLGHFADHERVVADSHERLRQPLEEPLLFVLDGAETAMKKLARIVDRAPADVGQGLMAKTDAKHGNPRLVERRERDPDVTGSFRATRAR